MKLWNQLEGPALVPQFKFHPVRKWRFDFCHPESRTAIEIQGGIWNYGGHSRGSGILRDMEKENEAIRNGYVVLKCAVNTINADFVALVREVIQIRTTKNYKPTNEPNAQTSRHD